MNPNNLENPAQVIYFEDVLPKTGWGLYYKFMLGMACVCSFANAFAWLCVPFAISLSTCENAISKDLLYGFPIAMGLGRILLGNYLNVLYDIYGRKQYISYSLMIIFMSSFTAAFSYNYYVVILASFFLAGGLECNSSSVKVHLAETLPRKKRAFYLTFCDIFWFLGYLSLAIIAVYLHNSGESVDKRVVDMNITTWRLMFAIAGGVHLLLACSAALLEESPRFYLYVKKTFFALMILKQFFAVNKSCYGESFPVREEDLKYVVEDYNIPHLEETMGYFHQISTQLDIFRRSIRLLFSRILRKTTISLIFMKSSLFILGILEMNVLMARTVTTSTAVRDGLDVLYLEPRKNGSLCSSYVTNKDLYFNFFIISLNIFIGRLLLMFFLDRIGRNVNLGIFFVMAGVCILISHVTENSMSTMLMASLLLLAHGNNMTIISIITIESFPTALRGTAHAVTNFPGIILSLVLLRLLQYYKQWFPVIVGILYISSAALVYFLTELKCLPLIE